MVLDVNQSTFCLGAFMNSAIHGKTSGLVSISLTLGLLAAFSVSTALGQQAEAVDDDASSMAAAAPVAYVYVSYGPGGSTPNKIAAYAAASNGSLTTVPGSPFADNVASMAVNGKYLFGSTLNGIYVSAFTMEANGALHYSTSTEVDHADPDACTYAETLHLDHTGSTLYRTATVGDLCDSEEYESFQVNSSTGSLHYLGHSGSQFLYSTPISFLSNDVYAYGSDCVPYEVGYIDTFQALKRSGSGLLNSISVSAPTPAAMSSEDFYCRSMTAADPAGHLAVSMQAIDGSSEEPDGLPRLGVYTAAANGNLTTTSTYSNLPKTSVGDVFDLAMSPSGKLLAVAGESGLQIFHFNGASPITPYTGLLTTTGITQIFWDDTNHLYGIGYNANKLFVFTVTPTSASAAPGSPHSIASVPVNLIVKPKT